MPLQFVAQQMYNRGTSSPCVARTMVQTSTLMESFPIPPDVSEEISQVSHAVMGRLIALDDVRERVTTQIDNIKMTIGTAGLAVQAGGRYAEVPGVINLQLDVDAYLSAAKLALRDIAGLFKPLYGQDFDHRYQRVRQWAERAYTDADNLVLLLKQDEPWITRIIEMRNAIEHPKTEPRAPLTVRNFFVQNSSPPWDVAEPSWFLKDESPASIATEMNVYADNLLTFYEDIVADGLLRRRGKLPLGIAEIPEAERRVECPTRLRVVWLGDLSGS